MKKKKKGFYKTPSTFHAKNSCDSRIYEYFIPTFMFRKMTIPKRVFEGLVPDIPPEPETKEQKMEKKKAKKPSKKGEEEEPEEDEGEYMRMMRENEEMFKEFYGEDDDDQDEFYDRSKSFFFWSKSNIQIRRSYFNFLIQLRKRIRMPVSKHMKL